MFKGACRLDDPAHRTIIFFQPIRVKNFRVNWDVGWLPLVALCHSSYQRKWYKA